MRRLGTLLAGLALVGTALPVTTAQAAAEPEPTVIGQRVIGHSVQGRPIVAYHLGEQRAGVPTVVLISSMHGNEAAPRQLLRALVDGEPVRELDLWVVPSYNPDGLAAGSRRNAHGVDLNRNYPRNWADLDGNYESGPRPGSEPETKAMMTFLRRVEPDHVLSFHQPLHGVDTDNKRPAFARRVARVLHLPVDRFDCGGVCHGTMTSWYNHTFPGNALTIEYGARPGPRLMREIAPEQVLRIFGAWRGYRTVEEEPTAG
jgi:hypothetical protein